MQEEIWKDIPGYIGLYQVSNLGNVKSLPKEWITGVKTIKNHNGKILKVNTNNIGYYQVGMSNGINKKTYRIHQLVAMAFLGHTPNGSKKIVVDHINANKLDNRVENLQVISQRENCSKDKKNKASKYTGVCWSKNDKKWKSAIRINGKILHLGYFKCETSAHLAYQNKLKQII
jgi:hypothetical protein